MASQEVTNDREEEDLKQKIAEVRRLVLEEVEGNSELVDESDIEKLKTDDWTVERFLRRKRYNVQETSNMIYATLKWRKELELPTMQDNMFPEEFFRIGAIFGYAKDRDNNGVVYMRVRLHRKIKELDREIKQFIMYTINKVDLETDGRGMAVVFDCKGAGLSNMDMDTLWFMVNSLISYYPYGLSYILVYDLPWILTSAWNVVKGWLPVEQRDKIKFTSKDGILEFIDKENLPLYMGGECKINYHAVPKGCRPALELGPENGISEKDVKRIIKVFKPYLDEADEEIKILNQNTCPMVTSGGD